MAVAYDRARFFSFALHGSESSITPVVARVLEIGLFGCEHATSAKLLSADEIDELQDGTLGDVNVGNIIAVVESALDEPASGAAEPVVERHLTLLSDIFSLVSVANRRFKKSPNWPTKECTELLSIVGTKVAEPAAEPVAEPASEPVVDVPAEPATPAA